MPSPLIAAQAATVSTAKSFQPQNRSFVLRLAFTFMLLGIIGKKYERKTNRGNNKENLEKAADAVKNLGKSIRSAVKVYSVCHV